MFEVSRKNKIKTGVIITGISMFVSVALYFIAYAMGYGQYAVLITVSVSLLMSLGSYWFSDKIVLSLNHARPANQEEDRKLNNILEGLSIASGIPKPKLYIIDDPAPNAFATGRNPQNAVIGVTTGLLDTMDYYQLEGVLAHEMAHIKNYDILLQTIASVMIGTILILSDYFLRILWFGGSSRRSRDDNGGSNVAFMILGLVFVILSPILGQLMKMALSRNREYLADSTGVEFTRNPEGLASALEKLGSANESMKNVTSATEGLYIATPISSMAGKKTAELFSTHPPIEKRIIHIRNLR